MGVGIWDEGREKKHSPVPYSPRVLVRFCRPLPSKGVCSPKPWPRWTSLLYLAWQSSRGFPWLPFLPIAMHSFALWLDYPWEGGGGELLAPFEAVPTCLSAGCFKESDLDRRLVFLLSSYTPYFEMRRWFAKNKYWVENPRVLVWFGMKNPHRPRMSW